MKKQILAAAVIATMTTAAMAEVKMTGKYKGVLENTPADDTTYVQKIDLSIKGTAGKSVVVVNMDLDNTNKTSEATTGADAIMVSESYIKTKVAGISIAAGDMKGLTGKGLAYKKSEAKTKVAATAALGDMKVKLQQVNGSDATIDVWGKLGPAKVKVQDVTGDNPTFSATGSVGDVSGTVEKNDNVTAFSVSTEVAGSKVTFLNVDMQGSAKATQDDGLFGNITDATKVTGVAVSTPVQIGTLTGKYWNSTKAGMETNTMKATLSTGGIAYSVTKPENTDAAFDATLKIKF